MAQMHTIIQIQVQSPINILNTMAAISSGYWHSVDVPHLPEWQQLFMHNSAIQMEIIQSLCSVVQLF